MKSIKMMMITILMNLVIFFPYEGKAQNMVLEAKQNLVNKKAELLLAKDYFNNRIDTYKEESNNSKNNEPINVLNTAIAENDKIIEKIEKTIKIIDNIGIVDEYKEENIENNNITKRKYNFSDGNDNVEISKKISDNVLIIKLNNEIILEGNQVVASNNKEAVKTITIETNSEKTKNKYNFKPHFSGCFLGINGYLNSDKKNEAPNEYSFFEINETRSLAFDLYLTEFHGAISNFCGIAGGLNLQFNHYAFEKAFDLDVVDGKLVADYSHLKASEFKRFNYRIMHLSVPILIEFQMPTNKDLYLTAGVLGGIRIGSRTKQIYEENSKRQKNTNRKTFETNLLKYSFIGGFGYKGIQIFGEYSPVSIFKKDHGPEIYPYSIGIKLNF
ncbi:MAG: hypothetical protein MJ211_02805 [Bacteroidales bacterium]|nr:hypothetical protein [Bacteroidales bacterium]